MNSLRLLAVTLAADEHGAPDQEREPASSRELGLVTAVFTLSHRVRGTGPDSSQPGQQGLEASTKTGFSFTFLFFLILLNLKTEKNNGKTNPRKSSGKTYIKAKCEGSKLQPSGGREPHNPRVGEEGTPGS